MRLIDTASVGGIRAAMLAKNSRLQSAVYNMNAGGAEWQEASLGDTHTAADNGGGLQLGDLGRDLEELTGRLSCQVGNLSKSRLEPDYVRGRETVVGCLPPWLDFVSSVALRSVQLSTREIEEWRRGLKQDELPLQCGLVMESSRQMSSSPVPVAGAFDLHETVE